MSVLQVTVFVLSIASCYLESDARQVPRYLEPVHDTFHGNLSVPPPPMEKGIACSGNFRCKWLSSNGAIYNQEYPGMLELSATVDISDYDHWMGGNTIHSMMINSPPELFEALVGRGTVGFFTFAYGTTIFPEYQRYRDRPECSGTCSGGCSNTCTGDGRKYDSLAGLGGSRATCVDVNYMCKPGDPYRGSSNILIHEFAHTLHQYALPYVRPGGVNYWNAIYNAWTNARSRGTWTLNSYAMSNQMEYFAEAAGVFFNVNNHPTASGGMNRCGRPTGFCTSEQEARAFLESRDPDLFEALSYAFTDYRPYLLNGLTICP